MRETTAFSFSRAALIAVFGVFAFSFLAAEADAAPPSIESESVSGVTTSNAVLEAEIIPGDLEGDMEGFGGAWYQFQLVADPSEYWPELTCPDRHPESPIECWGPLWTQPVADPTRRPGDLPTRRLDASHEAQAVSLDLQSAGVVLQPGTTYHYRVLAAEATPTVDTVEWVAPPAYGPDQTFTTASIPPSLDPVIPPLASVSPPVVTLPGPVVKPRCQGKRKKVSFRRLGIQCRQAVVRARRR